MHTMCYLTPYSLTWCLDSDVMERVNADVISLEVECILTGVDGLQLVVVLEVWPAPETTVDDMRESFTM